MKLRLLSDLHCEGYRYVFSSHGEDVVVLAGDIHTINRHEHLISQIPATTDIVFVAGNHEFYRGEFFDVKQYLRSLEVKYPHFHFLDNEEKVIRDIPFFGGTMYSDFELMGMAELAKKETNKYINDFRVSMIGNRMWTVDDHVDQHLIFRDNLSKALEKTVPFRVVVSHFVPTPKVIHPRWNGQILNSYFTSNMESMMGWNGLWLYGHTHDSGEALFGDTRVIGNPRGYGSENEGGFIDPLIIEV